MEKHIQRKINNYCSEYRNVFLTELDEIISMLNKKKSTSNITEKVNELKMKCTFIAFPDIKKGELKKTKRIHSTVPENEKCNAFCSGGMRCSRRKQSGTIYCGTHVKGQPTGTINSVVVNTNNSTEVKSKEGFNKINYVYPVNENGIVKLYLDENRNNEINTNEFMKNYVMEK
jgi:hypothetical protein